MRNLQVYGMAADGTARCVNSEPGTFNHECGQPATWIATNIDTGFRACFCDDCKERGYERHGHTWERLAP